MTFEDCARSTTGMVTVALVINRVVVTGTGVIPAMVMPTQLRAGRILGAAATERVLIANSPKARVEDAKASDARRQVRSVIQRGTMPPGKRDAYQSTQVI